MRTHTLFVSARYAENETILPFNVTDDFRCPFVIKRIETQCSITYDPLLKYEPIVGPDDDLQVDAVFVKCPELCPKILGMCTASLSGQVTRTVTTVNGVSLADNNLRFNLTHHDATNTEVNFTMQRAGTVMIIVTFYDE